MMRKKMVVAVAVVGLVAVLGGALTLWLERDRPIVNVGKTGLALAGYDPVSYFEPEGPQLGMESLEFEYQARRYLFANTAHLEQFRASPDRYEPAFGGWCAYAVANGYKYEVDPTSYLVHDDRLLLFYSGSMGDAREAFIAEGTEDGVERADTNWPKVRLE